MARLAYHVRGGAPPCWNPSKIADRFQTMKGAHLNETCLPFFRTCYTPTDGFPTEKNQISLRILGGVRYCASFPVAFPAIATIKPPSNIAGFLFLVLILDCLILNHHLYLESANDNQQVAYFIVIGNGFGRFYCLSTTNLPSRIATSESLQRLINALDLKDSNICVLLKSAIFLPAAAGVTGTGALLQW